MFSTNFKKIGCSFAKNDKDGGHSVLKYYLVIL